MNNVCILFIKSLMDGLPFQILQQLPRRKIVVLTRSPIRQVLWIIKMIIIGNLIYFRKKGLINNEYSWQDTQKVIPN